MDLSDARIQKAIALHDEGKLGDAAAIYRDLLREQPQNVLVMHLLALVAMQFDNAKMVLALAEEALRIEPNFAVLHQDRATALRRLDRKEEAMAAIDKALLLKPSEADFFDTKAAILRDIRRYDEAIGLLKTAISLQPDNPKYYNNIGICLGRIGRNDEALHFLDKYIALKPDDATGYNNKANILKACSRYEEAVQNYDKALALNPHIFMGRANKGITHLVLGQYRQGWELFEDRKPGNKPPEADRFDAARRWTGQVDRTATLILYNEQGLGDTLHFCRYIDAVRERVGHLVVQAQKPLLALLQRNWPTISFITPDDPVPDYSFQCPLMSLPHIFGTTLESIPRAAGYLKANAAKIAEWKNRLADDGKRKVGLVWAGNPDHMNDHIRSIPLSLFVPLLKKTDMHFYALQKGEKALEQMRALPKGLAPLTPLGDELNDFEDTAGLLMNLDQLITVDTSVLHMAGALGCPAWGLLQFDPDWRWLISRPDTPWYDSLRLFRQDRFGDWAGVIAKVVAAF